jgi:hypothetical protein
VLDRTFRPASTARIGGLLWCGNGSQLKLRPMQPIATAPRDGKLIRLWLRSETAPLTGYWSRSVQGWCPWREIPPLVLHNLTHWEPVQDQAAARAEPQIRLRRPCRPIVVVGLPAAQIAAPQPTMPLIVVARRPRPVAPVRRPRKPILVLGLQVRAAIERDALPMHAS